MILKIDDNLYITNQISPKCPCGRKVTIAQIQSVDSKDLQGIAKLRAGTCECGNEFIRQLQWLGLNKK
jgi:hypothetical protein